MGENESIRGNVADVYVHTDDIKDCAVTSAKIAGSAGKVFAGVLTGSATSGYVTLVTVTVASTFYRAIVVVTAAGTSGGVTLEDTASNVLVNAIACSAAAANYTNETALNSALTVDVAAGASLCALYTTGTATANFRAHYILSYITTPS